MSCPQLLSSTLGLFPSPPVFFLFSLSSTSLTHRCFASVSEMWGNLKGKNQSRRRKTLQGFSLTAIERLWSFCFSFLHDQHCLCSLLSTCRPAPLLMLQLSLIFRYHRHRKGTLCAARALLLLYLTSRKILGSVFQMQNKPPSVPPPIMFLLCVTGGILQRRSNTPARETVR